MTVCAVITARLASTRLPGKALLPIQQVPMLQRVVDRVHKANVNKVIVATTIKDHEIANYCIGNDIPVYQGSERDILDRVYTASYGYDTVVRVWGDSPLIDHEIINSVIRLNQLNPETYSINVGYPSGLDTSAIKRKLLGKYWADIIEPTDREWIHKHLKTTKTSEVKNETDQSMFNLSVNTQDDLDFMDRVYEGSLTWQQSLKLLKK